MMNRGWALFGARTVIRRAYAIRDGYITLVKPVAVKAKSKQPQRNDDDNHDDNRANDNALIKTRLPKPVYESSYQEDDDTQVVPSTTTTQEKRVVTAAIVGLPNAGKSSLLNALIGVSLAAVSSKPHTTRGRVLGAFTRGNTQVVFLDTPGIVPKVEQSKRSPDLIAHPWSALRESNVSLVVVDATQPDDWRLPELAMRLQREVPREQILMVLNKIDAIEEGDNLIRTMDTLKELGLPMEDPFLVSATRGTHLSDIEDELVKRASVGEWAVDPSQVTDRNVVWRVHEAIRQCLFENLHKEVPYAIKQHTVGFRDTPELLSVQQELHVPKLSQARLAVGRRGEMVQRIALGAAAILESALGKKVEIALHFKHSPRMPERDDFDD